MALGRKKILWVDDEIEFLRAHIMFLETRGYSVIPSYNGDDAIHILKERPQEFDIVLLDEQMPGKNGLVVLEEIKDFLPNLPVVMVTKSEEEHVMEEAIGKKIDGYLTKPVNPSQILSVCKKLLDGKSIISSQIAQRFSRNYSEVRTILAAPLEPARWSRLHDHFTRWDYELEKNGNEGIRQAHIGQKFDANALFSNFVMEHYARWIRGLDNPPVLSTNVIRKGVLPLLSQAPKVYLIMLENMRLDQYLAIETHVKDYFTIEKKSYFSVLPTASLFTRASLYAGAPAVDVAKRCPDEWQKAMKSGEALEQFEEDWLKAQLTEAGFKGSVVHRSFDTTDEAKRIDTVIDECADAQFVSLAIRFTDLLVQHHKNNGIVKEIAPDEGAFKTLTRAWFLYSPIFALLKKLAEQNCTVVLTTDHGSVFCTRGSELYGSDGASHDMRYSFEKTVTCDERHALYLSDPAVYGLPGDGEGSGCVIAKENYYFIYPDAFENYERQYRGGFRCGGISLEEVIAPFAIMRPKEGAW